MVAVALISRCGCSSSFCDASVGIILSNQSARFRTERGSARGKRDTEAGLEELFQDGPVEVTQLVALRHVNVPPPYLAKQQKGEMDR